MYTRKRSAILPVSREGINDVGVGIETLVLVLVEIEEEVEDRVEVGG